MEYKQLKYLELEDDEPGINSFINNELRNEEIDVYVDYNDLENLEYLVNKVDNVNEFCDIIYDAYIEQIIDKECEIQADLEIKLAKDYNCDGVTTELHNYIEDYISTCVSVNIPYDKFLKEEVRVNLFITYNNSNDALEDDFDYTTLSKLLTNLGYKKPMTLLKELRDQKYIGEDKFLKSLQREFRNACSTDINYLCFIGKVTIEDYYMILNSKDNYILMPKDVTCGFVNSYHGGGSILGIELPRDYKIKTNNVKYLMLEKSGEKYTVDDIYGLVSSCYKDLKVL